MLPGAVAPMFPMYGRRIGGEELWYLTEPAWVCTCCVSPGPKYNRPPPVSLGFPPKDELFVLLASRNKQRTSTALLWGRRLPFSSSGSEIRPQVAWGQELFCEVYRRGFYPPRGRSSLVVVPVLGQCELVYVMMAVDQPARHQSSSSYD